MKHLEGSASTVPGATPLLEANCHKHLAKQANIRGTRRKVNRFFFHLSSPQPPRPKSSCGKQDPVSRRTTNLPSKCGAGTGMPCPTATRLLGLPRDLASHARHCRTGHTCFSQGVSPVDRKLETSL